MLNSIHKAQVKECGFLWACSSVKLRFILTYTIKAMGKKLYEMIDHEQWWDFSVI